MDYWTGALRDGARYYVATSILAFSGIIISYYFIELCTQHPQAQRPTMATAFAAWDGSWYAHIVRTGYHYEAHQMSSIVFFPLFPLTAALVRKCLGISAELSLTLVSNTCLLSSFVFFVAYLRARTQHERPSECAVLLTLGLFPASFFFRVAYSESMFLMLAILAMLALRRRWHDGIAAFIIGLCSASRPVGITLVIPLVFHLWSQNATWRLFGYKTVLYGTTSCWGLAAFMVYQAVAFGDPFAFVKAHEAWSIRELDGTLASRAAYFLSLGPVRDIYDSTSVCCWSRWPPHEFPLLNLSFVNPLIFLVTAASLIIGYRYRVLSADEVVLGSLLLLIPYFSHGHRFCMLGMARYASVVFPAYIVYGWICDKMPRALAAGVLIVSGAFMAVYAALFSAWYWFI